MLPYLPLSGIMLLKLLHIFLIFSPLRHFLKLLPFKLYFKEFPLIPTYEFLGAYVTQTFLPLGLTNYLQNLHLVSFLGILLIIVGIAVWTLILTKYLYHDMLYLMNPSFHIKIFNNLKWMIIMSYLMIHQHLPLSLNYFGPLLTMTAHPLPPPLSAHYLPCGPLPLLILTPHKTH